MSRNKQIYAKLNNTHGRINLLNLLLERYAILILSSPFVRT